MEDFKLAAFRIAARTVGEWREAYGDEHARTLLVEYLSGITGWGPYNSKTWEMHPDFRAAYLTAFGR